MDERCDLVRSVHDGRYVYVRNYMPHLIYGQYLDYMFQTPTTQVWKRLYDEGKLSPPKTYFWEPKPAEELYDLQADRDEVHNLVHSPEHQAVLQRLRQAHKEHVLKVRDVGFLPEAEQHRRAAGTTMYEMGHDPTKYPLEKILAMADLASSRKPGVTAQLQQGLKNDDSGVRYWAAMGLMIRGRDAVAAARDDLRAALSDQSPSVGIVAARALGQYGSDADLALALPVLKTLAPPDKNGAYVSIEALNAVDALGSKAASLAEFLRAMPTQDPSAVGRANGYVDRLVERIVGERKRATAAPNGRPKGKRK
jgi:uncharacterized sulfatase